MRNIITGGADLIKSTIQQAKKYTKDMANDPMLEKMAGNPLLGHDEEMIKQANPLKLFKKYSSNLLKG